MRNGSFRYCMLIGALALAGVAVYYFATYMLLIVALGSSGMKMHYQDSVRALWLAFGAQSLLIALLYAIVAFRPHAVTREVIVICGLLQLTESLLLFLFSGNTTAVVLLGIAALCVMIGSVLWPKVVLEDPLAPGAGTPPGTPAA
ncbi:MAG: hypothetical protein QM696_09645 [Steroidobacteraceae bacterium]